MLVEINQEIKFCFLFVLIYGVQDEVWKLKNKGSPFQTIKAIKEGVRSFVCRCRAEEEAWGVGSFNRWWRSFGGFIDKHGAAEKSKSAFEVHIKTMIYAQI